MEDGSGLGALGAVGGLVFGLAIYLFLSFCLKLICEKAGHDPGILIWIPIIQVFPLLKVAGMPAWYVILLLIPFINIVVGLMLWWKICEARKKSPWLVLILFIPLVNVLFIPYLAFSD